MPSDVPSDAPSAVPLDVPDIPSRLLSYIPSDTPSVGPFVASDFPSYMPSDAPSRAEFSSQLSNYPSGMLCPGTCICYTPAPTDTQGPSPAFFTEANKTPKSCVIDFQEFNAGDAVFELGFGVVVTSEKRPGIGQPLVSAIPMIFDSANPTGKDFDLGAPNKDFGGPGRGEAGEAGRPYENRTPKGKILIISEDEDSSDPDENLYGGVITFSFETPTDIVSVGLLNDEDLVQFEIYKTDGSIVLMTSPVAGKNSFVLLNVNVSDAILLRVIFSGCGSIAEVNLSSCD